MVKIVATPVKVQNFFLQVKAAQELLATDERGQAGIEMSREQLVCCQEEDKHNRKIFLRPNVNPIKNDTRK